MITVKVTNSGSEAGDAVRLQGDYPGLKTVLWVEIGDIQKPATKIASSLVSSQLHSEIYSLAS
jgi:hypothetical protein